MTQQPSDETVLRAQLDEANDLVEKLRARCVILNVEVRRRDAQIAALTEQATVGGEVAPQPVGAATVDAT